MPRQFNYQRQESQPENATWNYGGVRFATLHVTGTNNGRDWVTGDPLKKTLAAVTERDANNAAWLENVFSLASLDDTDLIVIAMQADMTDVGKKSLKTLCVKPLLRLMIMIAMHSPIYVRQSVMRRLNLVSPSCSSMAIRRRSH